MISLLRLILRARFERVIFATHAVHAQLLSRSPSLTFVPVATNPLRPRLCDDNGVDEEYEPILSAIRGLPLRLILFNLFSLGAWHIADSIGVPSVAASPCFIPYSPPDSFAADFAAAHPALHSALSLAVEGQVGWSEVLHWMWPLFDAGRWGRWRRERLGLEPTPLLRGDGAPSPPPLPRATPLLYGISDRLLPPLPYWPASVHVCGFWLRASEPEPHAPPPLPAALCDALFGPPVGPLYVGLGSVSPLLLERETDGRGSPSRAEALLVAAADAALGHGGALLLHSCGCDELSRLWLSLLEPCSELVAAPEDEPDARLRVFRTRPALLGEAGSPAAAALAAASSPTSPSRPSLLTVVLCGAELRLDELLPRCACAIHHAGSGTIASCLLAPCPQLLLPLAFDQFRWSESLAHANLAVRLDERRTLSPLCPRKERGEYLLREVRAAAARLSASEAMRSGLLEEDGFESALRVIHELLRGAPTITVALPARQASGGAAAAAGAAPATTPAAAPPQLLAAAEAWGAKRRRLEQASAPCGSEAAGSVQAVRVRLGDGLPVPIWCHSPSEAAHIFDEIWNRRAYLPGASGLALPRDGLLVDVGANIGLFSIWAARSSPSLQIVAIEPAPPSFALLEANLNDAAVSERVAALRLALGARRCASRTLTFYPAAPGNSTFFPAEKAAEGAAFAARARSEMRRAREVACEVQTLSDVLRGRGHWRAPEGGGEDGSAGERAHATVGLLKVDVEGCEVEVLSGVHDEHWPSIEQVVVETHGTAKRRLVVELLRGHYEVVGEEEDAFLRTCGLDRAIVYASCPRPRRAQVASSSSSRSTHARTQPTST